MTFAKLFFLYMLGIIFGVLASYRGYTEMLDWMALGLFEILASFISASVYYFWVAGAVAWLGKGISDKKKSARRILSIPIFGFAVSMVLHNGANMILTPDTPIYSFILAIISGFVLLFVAVYVEKK